MSNRRAEEQKDSKDSNSIELADRYKLIFEEHHYSSDFRAKIIQGWYVFYGALIAGLAWTQAPGHSKGISYVFGVFGFVITFFMWAADYRHRGALSGSKKVGAAIEKAANIPKDQRFFALIASGWFSHSLVIDSLSGSILALSLRLSIFLKQHDGDLGNPPGYLASCGLAGAFAGAAFHFTSNWIRERRSLLTSE
jgi:hypothetical protein